jgi:transglutaminase-like putative cysteine protease
MRLEIRYFNQFNYEEQARESHNVLRACPSEDDVQRLISYDLVIAPPARVFTYVDYWGTRVDAFGIREPHQRLQVAAFSVVETLPRPSPDGAETPFSAYRQRDIGLNYRQFLQRTDHTGWGEAVAEAAVEAVAGAPSALEAIRAIHDHVADRLEYVTGVTQVGADVNAVLEQGEGVCQDFAHLAIALCRSVGIPARYVSGYFYAADQAAGDAPEQAEVEVQTHAWIEALVPEWGWWAFDPTNAQPVGERHVKIGHGRDYDDVTPLRGVYHGPAEHTLGVAVRMSRESLSALRQQQQQQ